MAAIIQGVRARYGVPQIPWKVGEVREPVSRNIFPCQSHSRTIINVAIHAKKSKSSIICLFSNVLRSGSTSLSLLPRRFMYVLILTSILGVCLFHFIGTAPFHLDFPPSFVHLHGQTRSLLATAISVPSVGHPLRSKPSRILHEGADSDKFDAKLTEWLAALNEIVEHMSDFLEQGCFGRV